jgi:hypothetical protein
MDTGDPTGWAGRDRGLIGLRNDLPTMQIVGGWHKRLERFFLFRYAEGWGNSPSKRHATQLRLENARFNE